MPPGPPINVDDGYGNPSGKNCSSHVPSSSIVFIASSNSNAESRSYLSRIQNAANASRAASFSHIAASSCRLSRTIMQLGQAAGMSLRGEKQQPPRGVFSFHSETWGEGRRPSP
ncbi:MAG TPA: FAD-dependent oxidoreductase [Firmicutes bacterium]|nr:FAD-dependent oxidoreductase [Bacillota bacterium]